VVDLDSLAGAVAYRHCLPKPTTGTSENATEAFHHASARAGLYLATASADRLDIFGTLDRRTPRYVYLYLVAAQSLTHIGI
jgi:acyl-coenzyme A thioesterase 9